MFKYILPILLFVSNAYALPEICGDGFDNDASGTYGSCPAGEVNAMYGTGCDKFCDPTRIDADGDTYGTAGLAPWGAGRTAGIDCDDTDIEIYPEMPTIKGCPVGQFRTCQASGIYNTCAPLSTYCPSSCTTGCFYFNKNTGNNSNAGTYASPWRDYKIFVSYYTTAEEPAGYHNPVAGNCFIETGGADYSDTYSYQGNTRALYLRNKSGIAIYGLPGTRWNIDTAGTGVAPIEPVYLQATSNIRLQNMRIAGNYVLLGGIVTIGGNSGNTYENIVIGPNNTLAGSNGAGIQLGAVDIGTHLFNILAVDNYDPLQPLNENNANIVTFRDEGTLASSVRSIYTNPTAIKASCYKQKHSNPTSNANFFGGTLQGCTYGFDSGGPTHYVRYNRFDNVEYPYHHENLGGPSFATGTRLFSNNTITNGNFFYIMPENNWNMNGSAAADACSGNQILTPWTIEHNVVIDSSASYPQDFEFAKIHRYGPDSLRTASFPSLFAVTQNCEYNTGLIPLVYTEFGTNNGQLTCSGRGVLGNNYPSFSSWQGTGLDAGSFNVNPSLDSDGRASSSSCANFGFRRLSQLNGGSPPPPSTSSYSKKRILEDRYNRRRR